MNDGDNFKKLKCEISDKRNYNEYDWASYEIVLKRVYDIREMEI